MHDRCIAVGRVQVIVVHASDAVGVSQGIEVQTPEHERLEVGGEEVREFFEDHDEGGADEAAPVRVPGVVDYGWVGWGTYGGLFGVDLVVAVPVIKLDMAC